MDLGLTGRVAIVTGASRGIGASIAEELAAEGMAVVIAARSRDRLDALAVRLEGRATAVYVHAGDLSLPAAAARQAHVRAPEPGRRAALSPDRHAPVR
jgi:short-subunit dehydrogenase